MRRDMPSEEHRDTKRDQHRDPNGNPEKCIETDTERWQKACRGEELLSRTGSPKVKVMAWQGRRARDTKKRSVSVGGVCVRGG